MYTCHLYDRDGVMLDLCHKVARDARGAADLCFVDGGGRALPDQIFFVSVVKDLIPIALIVRNDTVRKLRLFAEAIRGM